MISVLNKVLIVVFVACVVLLVFYWPSDFDIDNKYYVTGIVDGDTIHVAKNNKTFKVRLAEIDAPEKSQAFGTKAKETLAEKIFNKDVHIVFQNKDHYNREIGKVYLGSRYINWEMVKEGCAWHYKTYSKSQDMAEAENKARVDKAGLWTDSNPVPPWNFRTKSK